jgi:hypothetical protein
MNFKLWEVSYTTRTVLSKVFSIQEDDRNRESKQDTERFWRGDDSFYQWLQKNGVNFNAGQVPSFAEGGVGRAYFVGDKVIKFTKNRVEANVAKAAMGQQDSPTAIIDVWRAPGGAPLWAILQKYVNVDVEKELKTAADIATAVMDELRAKNPNFTNFPTDQRQLKKLATDAAREYKQPAAVIPYIISAMNAINQLYFKTGFTHDDAGPTNIGRDMTTGNIVFHDLGPNVTKGFMARPALDRIHKNREQLGLPPLVEV